MTNIAKLKTAMTKADDAGAAQKKAEAAVENALATQTPNLTEEKQLREQLPATLIEVEKQNLTTKLEKLEAARGRILDQSNVRRKSATAKFEHESQLEREVIHTHTEHVKALTELYNKNIKEIDKNEQEQLVAIDLMESGVRANLDQLAAADT